MADDWDTVSVWLGWFSDEPRLEAYLHETYVDDDSDPPISAFAVDQDQWSYDHDFLEVGFKEAAGSVTELVRGHSSSYVEAVAQRASKLALPESLNTVFLVWGREIREPRSARGSGYDLAYLGEFPCNPESPA